MSALEKHRSILTTLASLRNRFGEALQVVDHWDGDLRAVGVARAEEPDRLVYFSTWKRRAGRYSVDLEFPLEAESDLLYRQGESFSDVDFETLASIIGRHLERES